jgi:hypothetical protein
MTGPHTGVVLEKRPGREKAARPTAVQRAWLRRGLNQPGGKLPLFDRQGQMYSPRTIQSCLAQSWAEPWSPNPIKPNWMICKLTDTGRAVVSGQTRKN